MGSFFVKKEENMEKENILGFNVITYYFEKLVEEIYKDYENNEQLFIVNVNPEIAVANYKNKEFKEILNKQKYQIPDGSGIVWASKKNNGKIETRITGIDLMLKLCEKSQNYSSRIFLYGAKQEIVEKAAKELETKYPEINIVGTCNGYEKEEKAVTRWTPFVTAYTY